MLGYHDTISGGKESGYSVLLDIRGLVRQLRE